jgi:hypothetical protein
MRKASLAKTKQRFAKEMATLSQTFRNGYLTLEPMARRGLMNELGECVRLLQLGMRIEMIVNNWNADPTMISRYGELAIVEQPDGTQVVKRGRQVVHLIVYYVFLPWARYDLGDPEAESLILQDAVAAQALIRCERNIIVTFTNLLEAENVAYAFDDLAEGDHIKTDIPAHQLELRAQADQAWPFIEPYYSCI